MLEGSAHGPGCEKVVVLLDADDRSAHHPRIADAGGDPQNHDDLQETLPGDGHDRQQEQQSRERHPGIDESLHRQIQFPADKPRRAAYQHRHHNMQRGRGQTDEQREASPVDEPAQEVPPELVGAQGIHTRWAGQPIGQLHLIGIMPGQGPGKDADQNQQQQDNASERPQGLLLYQSLE